MLLQSVVRYNIDKIDPTKTHYNTTIRGSLVPTSQSHGDCKFAAINWGSFVEEGKCMIDLSTAIVAELVGDTFDPVDFAGHFDYNLLACCWRRWLTGIETEPSLTKVSKT